MGKNWRDSRGMTTVRDISICQIILFLALLLTNWTGNTYFIISCFLCELFTDQWLHTLDCSSTRVYALVCSPTTVYVLDYSPTSVCSPTYQSRVYVLDGSLHYTKRVGTVHPPEWMCASVYPSKCLHTCTKAHCMCWIVCPPEWMCGTVPPSECIFLTVHIRECICWTVHPPE